MTSQPITWQAFSFNQLTTEQFFELCKLRIDVFVVEQNCAYPELDHKDRLPSTIHLCGYVGGELAAYARLLDRNVSYPDCVSIGRVVVNEQHRALKLGDQLLERAIEEIEQRFAGVDIEIGAQAHLQRFYAKHGFAASSEPYLEDGIPHVDMRRVHKAS